MNLRRKLFVVLSYCEELNVRGYELEELFSARRILYELDREV